MRFFFTVIGSAGQKESEEEEERQEREFWEKPCAFSPESRLEAHRHLEAKKRTTTAWVVCLY